MLHWVTEGRRKEEDPGQGWADAVPRCETKESHRALNIYCGHSGSEAVKCHPMSPQAWKVPKAGTLQHTDLPPPLLSVLFYNCRHPAAH